MPTYFITFITVGRHSILYKGSNIQYLNVYKVNYKTKDRKNINIGIKKLY